GPDADLLRPELPGPSPGDRHRRRGPGAAGRARHGLADRGDGAGDAVGRRDSDLEGRPAVPPDAGQDRRHQRGAARADHRHPGAAGLRARGPRARALRHRQRQLTDLNRRIGLLMALLNPIIMFIINFSSVLVLFVAAPRIEDGEMQVGSITAFIAYLVQILIAVMMATFMTMMIPRAMVSAERITEVLETETSVVQRTDGIRELTGPTTLEFDDVSFTYPGAERPVLENISFSARAGQTVAIIGGTGSGKTTLVNLIPRLTDASEGRVLLNGVDVRDLDAQVLWDRIGLVPQWPYLFSGTVGSNLRFGRPDAT